MNLLSLALLAGLSTAEEARHWKTISVCNGDGIVVRLKVLGRASLATPDWMAIEIDNLGKVPRKVKLITFRMESEAEHLTTGKKLFSGSLASGQRFDPDGKKLFTNGRYRDV